MAEASSGPKERKDSESSVLFCFLRVILILFRRKKNISTHTHTLWLFWTVLIKREHGVFSFLLKASSLSLSCWIYNAKKQNPRNLFLFT